MRGPLRATGTSRITGTSTACPFPETTLKFLDDNNTIWNGKVAFAAAVTEAKDGVKEIRKAAARQELPTGGITDEKGQARGALEDLALEVADEVSAFAAKTGNASLSADVRVSRSSLDQAQDDDLVQTAERIRDAANTNVASLADYGVTAAEVTALSDAITAFSGMKTAPRTAKASKRGATTSIASMVETTRSLFRTQLDKLMTPFRKTNPEFYTGYFAARVIVDRAGTRPSAPTTPPPNPPNP
jgi:hypothetical protein